ncbi:MAG: hypothetical protein E3J24_00055 [Dehalococcoidia bacterium]|nr:MAG: hypothetical protein E3J24_00055 [Dehalococcoidia bacterium]
MVIAMPSAIAEQTIEEHEELLNLINELESALTNFPRDIVWGSSSWAQDHDFLDFVRVQRISLTSARESVLKGFYREAYNTIRMILEGYLLLRLIGTCDRYPTWYRVRRVKGDRSLDDAKARFKYDAQKTLTDLVKIEDEDKNTIVLIRRGIRILDEQGNDTGVIFPYYLAAWQRYQPVEHFLKKLEVQKELLPEWAVFKSVRAKLSDVDHRYLYMKLFTFDSMVRNLRLNGVLSIKTTARVTVHYNFLSGFTHSLKHAVSISQPWHSFAAANADMFYNHYKSELALLYVCHLLAMHLESELDYFKRWRALTVRNVHEIYRPLCEKVHQDFDYFWFIFNKPHAFDKYQQANRKCNYKKGIIYRPEDIRSSDVRYYDDPLDRLLNMHQSMRELSTGNVFDSPFPRDDARFPIR